MINEIKFLKIIVSGLIEADKLDSCKFVNPSEHCSASSLQFYLFTRYKIVHYFICVSSNEVNL